MNLFIGMHKSAYDELFIDHIKEVHGMVRKKLERVMALIIRWMTRIDECKHSERETWSMHIFGKK